MHLGGAVIIAGDEAVQDFGEEQPLLGAEPAHDAEVDGDQPAVIVDEQISRMHVGVKEAVAQRVAEKCLDQRAGELRQIETLGSQPRAVGQRRGVDPFQRQHFLGGAVPIDRRHAEIRIVLGVLGHLRERRRLEAEIHLDHDRAPQRLDHFDEPQPPRLGGKILGVPRGEGEGARSAWKRRSTPGRSTLTATARGPPAVATVAAMHLRDRGGGDRRAEARKHRFERLAERGGDRRFGLALRERRHLVLQPLEIWASAAPTTSGRVARNWPSLT